MNLTKETMKQLRGLIVFTLLLLIGLWKFDIVLSAAGFVLNIIFPFILGGAIAFILNVPMNFIERNLFEKRKWYQKKPEGGVKEKIKSPLSLVLTILFVIGLLLIVTFVVVPELGNTFVSLSHNIQTFIPEMIDKANTLFHDNPEIIKWVNSFEFNWDQVINTVLDFFRHGAGSVLDSTFAAAKSIVSGIATFFIAFVFACYVLLQKKKLSVQVKKVMYAFLKKPVVEQTQEVCSLTYRTFSNFLTGQCVEAVILGCMFFISMTVLRFPYALLIGVLITVTALIPIFGAFIGCIVGAFLILMVSPMQAVGFVILFLVLQQIEGNLIYPHVVGGSVGLPSIWVLVAVTLGSSLMGIVGMLIFIPIVSVLYTLFRRWVYQRLKEKKIKVEE